MSTRIFGSGIRRREDPRLITGTATYTDDLTLPRMVYAAMLRSPHAHARITSIDTSKAAAAARVVAVYTHADTEGALQPTPCAWLLPDSDLKVATYHGLAKDVVRYVGDIVAVVVAENRYAAEDALELIEVDYEPLPAVIDPEQAAEDGAPQLHDEIPRNQAFHWAVAGGDIDAAFEQAEVVVSDRIIQQRLIPNAMETRAALASYTTATGELTLWNTTQNPHIVRFLMSLVCGLGEDKIRVVAPEVGGGFGSKLAVYPADFVTVFCSMRLGRPGQMDRDAQRELPGHDARAGPRSARGAGGQEGRHGHRAPVHGVCRHGRVSLDRRARDSDDPARADALGCLHAPGGQGGRLRHLHQRYPG